MDIKSKILKEVEEIGSGYVQMMNDAFEKCPTLNELVSNKRCDGCEKQKNESIRTIKMMESGDE